MDDTVLCTSACCAAISFDVDVDDTAAANLCNLYGKHRLVLTNEHVTLVDESDSPVLSWLYRCARDCHRFAGTHTGSSF